MAKEIAARYTAADATLYATILSATGQLYNALTPGFEAIADANWTSTKYCRALTEEGTSTQIYTGDFPIIAAGRYTVNIYVQAGGSPALSDTLYAVGSMDWDGTAESGNFGLPNAAAVRTAVGLASANLDTQLLPLATAPYVAGSVNDASATTGQFVAAAGLSASDDFYNGCVVAFTSGALKGIARAVSDYTGSSRTFTFTGAAGQADAVWPAAPANGVTFIVIGRAE